MRCKMSHSYIWLFGENLGETANNNSYYMWLNCVEKDDCIEKYFVLKKTSQNIKLVNRLSKKAKEHICWKNSVKHFQLWYDASMYFVTLSYKDVRPEKFLFKQCDLLTEKPVVYLQHGVLGIKQIGYDGTDYNNNMFRFIYYNQLIKEDLININGFKSYQLVYGEYMPRHQELVKQYFADKHINTRILFFPTWREYFGDNFDTKVYIQQIKRLVSNVTLNKYLQSSGAEIKICLHPFFSKTLLTSNNILENKNISITTPKETNILHEIATCDVCITDYSSIGFDFTLLEKPVILFQPDREAYLEKRSLYCSLDELKSFSVDTVEELVNLIVSKKYAINKFFRKRLPNQIDLKYIREGKHTEKLYEYFWRLQNNSIVFLGYNFYGVGGTVNATHALAEGLLEQGYLVTLFSLKKHADIKGFAKGLNMRCLISERSGKKLDCLKKVFNKIILFKGYFVNDAAKNNIGSYIHFALARFLRHNNFRYYVSTRESIHLYLDDANNIPTKNKFYFYHTDAKVVDIYFPSVMREVVKRKLDNSIFVTLNNKLELADIFGFLNYKKSIVLGNALASNRCLSSNDLECAQGCNDNSKNVKRGIFLLRITSEREDDLSRLLDYGNYLIKNKFNDIVIDVYGDGDYKNIFIDKILKMELEKVIRYQGKVANPKLAIGRYDFVIDFSEKQSFGMTYIEAILNGKMIFCMHNSGSDEVLKECPECYFSDFDELTEKIYCLSKFNERFIERYLLVNKRYSREMIAKKFIEFISK